MSTDRTQVFFHRYANDFDAIYSNRGGLLNGVLNGLFRKSMKLRYLKTIEGCLAASAHSSHVYRSGLNLYFTFAVMTPGPQAMEAIYMDCWRRIMEATVKHCGSLAHHHGIGRVRRDWLT